MTKTKTLALAVTLGLVLGLTGCQESAGLSTDAITITQYKGVEIEQVEEPEVTDDDVTAYIDEVRALNDQVEVTDRAVEKGDFVDMDFVGRIDGEEFDGGSAEGYQLEIGSGDFIDGFEDSVIGHNIGDTYDWAGKFPDDYSSEDVAGKDVVFTITVNGIYEEQDVELTDEFVQQVSETATTVEEYEQEVRDQLTKEAEIQYKEDVAAAAWAVVESNTEFNSVDESEFTDEYDRLMGEYASYASYFGIDVETLATMYFGYEAMEDFEADVEMIAEQNVMDTYIVAAIADKEKLSVDDADTYEEMVEEMAIYYGYDDADSLKEQESEDDIKETALNFLVRDWVGDHCIQVATE